MVSAPNASSALGDPILVDFPPHRMIPPVFTNEPPSLQPLPVDRLSERARRRARGQRLGSSRAFHSWPTQSADQLLGLVSSHRPVALWPLVLEQLRDDRQIVSRVLVRGIQPQPPLVACQRGVKSAG